MHFALSCPTRVTERAFNALRRIKNYLRSIMTERKLKSCCLLNIHSTVTDELHVVRLMDVWIDRAAVRTNTFR